MRQIMLLSIIISMAMYSQSLRNDTIDCNGYKAILSIPTNSRTWISDYEEGFYKTYSLNNNSIVVIHYGAMTKDVTQPDSLIYECKLGNIASSVSYLKDKKYFRFDKYYQIGISLSFQFVTAENLALAEKIINNIEFVHNK